MADNYERPAFLNQGNNFQQQGIESQSNQPDAISSSTGAEVNFDKDQLDGFIRNRAIHALWERAYLCTCVTYTGTGVNKTSTAQPRQNCPRCHGRNTAYLPPQNLEVMITSQQKGISNVDLGMIDSGTAIGTPERGAKLGFRDRITLPSVTILHPTRFHVNNIGLKHGIRLLYDVKYVEYAVAEKNREVFELQEDDYKIDKKRGIFFPSSRLEGATVSLNLETTLRYVVADLLKEHRYDTDGTKQDNGLVRMPQKLLLRREDIFISPEAEPIGTDDETVQEYTDTKRQPSNTGLNGHNASDLNGYF